MFNNFCKKKWLTQAEPKERYIRLLYHNYLLLELATPMRPNRGGTSKLLSVN